MQYSPRLGLIHHMMSSFGKYEVLVPRLSLDHDPSHPGIEYCQNNEQTNYRSLTKRDELNSHGKEKKYPRSKDVYRPL